MNETDNEPLSDIIQLKFTVFTCVFSGWSSILLFYLIFTKTTPVFQTVKWYLIPSNMSRTITWIPTFLIQCRIYQKKSLMGCEKDGGLMTCFDTYIMLLAASSLFGIITSHIICCVPMFVKTSPGSQTIIQQMFSASYFFPLSVLFLVINPGFCTPSSINKTLTEHPDYYIASFIKYGAGLTNATFQNSLATWIVSVNLLILLCGYLFKICYLDELSSLKVLSSDKTRHQVRAMLRGFTKQAILPLIIFIPVAITSFYVKYIDEHPLSIAQFYIGSLLTLPTILDSVLTIFYIPPYRDAFYQICQCKFGDDEEVEECYDDDIGDQMRPPTPSPRKF